MKKILQEFKDFIARGNVLDMAIGVIIAGAFGKITTSLVNDVLMPFIGWICGTRDMTALNIVVREGVLAENGVDYAVQPITLGFGTLVGTIIDFLLIALVVFAIVKTMNAAKAKAEAKKKAEEAAAPPAPPAPSAEEVLLTEIRDLLKNK